MHHAYIYEGSQENLTALSAGARRLFGFEAKNNPDVHVFSFEKFGIDDAHVLTAQALLKSVSGKALFVVGIASITTEAQQALLKLFEEPQQGLIFVLLVPHGALIATLRSRMLEYPEKEKSIGLFAQQTSLFLKGSYTVRSAEIAALLKDEEDVKERLRDFLNTIEAVLYEKMQKTPTQQIRDGLADIARVRSYIADRSPSLKMLLEHLAMSLPQA